MKIEDEFKKRIPELKIGMSLESALKYILEYIKELEKKAGIEIS